VHEENNIVITDMYIIT